jgi:hypothetical protein
MLMLIHSLRMGAGNPAVGFALVACRPDRFVRLDVCEVLIVLEPLPYDLSLVSRTRIV